MLKIKSSIVTICCSCLFFFSLLFSQQVLACNCNDQGQMEGSSCAQNDRCLYLIEGTQDVYPPPVCGKNGCSAIVNTVDGDNYCYCVVAR